MVSYLPRFGGFGSDSFGLSARFGISGVPNLDGVGCGRPLGGLGNLSFGNFRAGAIGGSGAGIMSATGLLGRVRQPESGRTGAGRLAIGGSAGGLNGGAGTALPSLLTVPVDAVDGFKTRSAR
jgi:hypothetical protein